MICPYESQITFYNVDTLAAESALYGEGEGPILVDGARCVGDEVSLLACRAEELGLHNCDHDEDAGVLCPGMTLLEHVCLFS